MTKITDNSTLQSKDCPDHELWRLIKSWELLQDSQIMSPDDLADGEVDTLIKLERRIAAYTPSTIEGLQLKSLMVSHDYDEGNSDKDEDIYTDCALIKSIFRNIKNLKHNDNRLPRERYHSQGG